MYRVFRYKEHPAYWPATATVYIDVESSIEQYVTDENGLPTLVGSFSSIVTYPDYAGFPTPGREGRLYVDGTDFKTYIWTGTSYQLVGGGGTDSLVIGSTTITGATPGYLLYNNSGTLGQVNTTGTGSVVMNNSPTLVTPVLGIPSSGNLSNCVSFPASELIGTTLPAGIVASSLTSLGTIAALNATSLIVASDIRASYATFSTMAIFDISAKLISADTSIYPTLVELARLKGISSGVQTQLDNKQPAGSYLTTVTIGSTAITSGTDTKVLFNNAGVFGEYTISGSGNVAMTISPTFVTPILGTPTSGTLTNCTIPAGQLTGTTLPSGIVSSSLTSLGTVTTATLSTGVIVGGVTMTLGSDASYDTYFRGTDGVIRRLANGTTGQYLSANTGGAPSWQTPSGGGSPSGSSTYIQFNNAGSFGSSANFVYDFTNNRFGVGVTSPTHKVELVAGTLTDGQNAMLITATMPTTITMTNAAVDFQVTSAGSSAFSNRALNVNYLSGYTGNAGTFAANFGNAVAGTGTGVLGGSRNYGIQGNSSATTTGTNASIVGLASGGNLNLGVHGRAIVAKNSATNIGVIGTALNAGTTPVLIGGYFGLHDSSDTPTFVSGALVCDNGSQTSPIFLARDNGGIIFSINDVATDHVVSIAAGTILDTKSAFRLTATMPTTITATSNAVDFQITSAGSSSFQNNAVNIDYLVGYTGAKSTLALRVTNQVTGTGSNIIAGDSNRGVSVATSGTTTGTNIGVAGSASNGNINIGLRGTSTTLKNSATNIGVCGFGLNAGTTPIQIGGYFGLQSSDPAFTSAALMCDNGATTDPIFVMRDNGTALHSVIDGGNVGLFQTTPTSRLQLNYDQNSITQADANGLFLANATAATSGTQCVSPPFIQQANGWKTNATAGSQDARFRQDVVTSSGSSTTIATWQLAVSLNGGAYSVQMSVNTNSGVSINVATSISGTLTCNGDLVKGTFKAGGNNAYQSAQFLVGLADTNTQKYRQTNGGGDINTKLLCVYNGSNSTSGTLGVVVDATKGLIFTAANGTLMTARAAITIGSLTDTAGSEAADLLFHTQNAGAAYAANMRISKAGNVVIGNEAALSTSATDGFLYIPTCAGTPTGVPTAYTGKKAMVWDSTNKKLYIYDGSWIGGTVPGAFT